MTNTAPYALRPNDLLTGADRSLRFLSDVSRPSYLELQALVASGDLFAAIATNLDAISNSLTSDAPIVGPQLEHQINSLLYLQRHYKIIRKPADHRQ